MYYVVWKIIEISRATTLSPDDNSMVTAKPNEQPSEMKR